MIKTVKYCLAIVAVILLCGSCADKNNVVGLNNDKVKFFDAWVKTQKVAHPEFEWRETTYGSWVLITEPGAGAPAGSSDDSPYVLIDYTLTPLSNYVAESDIKGHYLYGRVINTTEETIARQVGTYVAGDYYGPIIVQRGQNAGAAGLDELLTEMKIGGRRWAIVPGWLDTTDRYSSALLYIQNVTGTNAAYDITLRDTIKNVNIYQLDSMKTFIGRHFPTKELDDTTATGWGCYYIQKKAPKDTLSFPSDTTFYINYTGRLLNGQVFDTTVADTAKVWGIYDNTKTYEPVLVNWGESASAITLTSSKSSVISGFSKGLWQMHHEEVGYSIFYSGLGYGSSGSGSSIPPFSPLMFELEIIKN